MNGSPFRDRRASMAMAAAIVSISACMTPACGDDPPHDPSPITVFAVTSVAPSSGPAGVEVTIAGSGFLNGATVTVGGVPAIARVASVGQILVTMPELPPGLVDIVVTNPTGARATLERRFTYVLLEITEIFPNAGFVGFQFFVTGKGFLPSARASIGGVIAGTGASGSTIVAIAPNHPVGPADVVVTNPGGGSATLAGGFTYYASPALTVTPTVVAPGGQLHVSYVLGLTSGLDWIGLYRLGADNFTYLTYQYISGLSGTVIFTAPAPGQYQFRYLPLDGYLDYARTETVTVTAPAPFAMAYDFADRFLTAPWQRTLARR